MNFSLFKFLLKKGLAFPRSKEELDYVKENVFDNHEEIETPKFEETWNYINEKQREDTGKSVRLDSDCNASGMSWAARFGGDINDETRKKMDKDKKEAKENF